MGTIWDEIAKFEVVEVKAWKNAKPVQQEARACVRMEAYVKLFKNWLDNEPTLSRQSDVKVKQN